MRLLHGTNNPAMTVHIGLCLTDDAYAAGKYASRSTARGRAHAVELNMAGLRVGRVDVGFDESGAPGDTAEECAEYAEDGFDIIKFEDDAYGYTHTTRRLVSEQAVAACRAAGEVG